MGKHYSDTKVLCPYYKHENPSVIFCESPISNTVLHLAFANRTKAMEHKNAFCRGCYEKCLLGRWISEYYEKL